MIFGGRKPDDDETLNLGSLFGGVKEKASSLFANPDMAPVLAQLSASLLQAGVQQQPGQNRMSSFASGLSQLPGTMMQARQMRGVEEARNLQGQKIKSDMADAAEKRQAGQMFRHQLATALQPQGGSPVPAPTSNMDAQDASVHGGGTEQIMPAGMFGGSPQQAAQRPSLFSNVPPQILQAASVLPPEQGMKLISDYQVKSTETGTWEPIKDAQGRSIGQRNRLTGEEKHTPGNLLDEWETFTDAKGNRMQRNKRTGQEEMVDKAPKVSVTNNAAKQDNAFQKKWGDISADMYGDISKAGISAPTKMANAQRLGDLLEQVNTGKFAGNALEVKRAAKAVGIDLDQLGIKDDVPAAQAAQSLSRQLALELRNPSGGAGMPGAMSDADRNYLESMLASIDKDPQANKSLIEARVKLLKREQDIAKLAMEHRKRNGTFDAAEFQAELADWSEKNPLFGPKKGQGGGRMKFDANGNPI